MPDLTCPRLGERWLPVVGFESYYEVSDWGRVRSLDRVTFTTSGPAVGHRRTYRGRVLRQTFTGFGHLKVRFSVNGEYTHHRVHRMVLEAFAGPCPEGMEALHGPEGKHDNHWLPDNSGLHWGTHAENVGADKVRDGTSNRGERQWLNKLTAAEVREIRVGLRAGATDSQLARQYNVHRHTIYAIRVGKSWGWLTEDPAA